MSDNEVSGAIKERLASPILGTFSLSLIICSWKIWIFAFSPDLTTVKIQNISEFLSSSEFAWAIAASFFLTIFILLALPFPKIWHEIWLENRKSRVLIARKKRTISESIEVNNLRSHFINAETPNIVVEDVVQVLSRITTDLEVVATHHRETVDMANSIRSRIPQLRESLLKLQSVKPTLQNVRSATRKVIEEF